MNRRSFLNAVGGTILGSAALAVGGWTYISRIEPEWIDYAHITLRLPRLPQAFDGYRIAHITDLHLQNETPLESVNAMFDPVLEFEPHLLAFTGDLTDERNNPRHSMKLLGTALERLTAQVETSTAVLGNHDHWFGANAVRGALAYSGINELANCVITVQRRSNRLWIAGLDDVAVGLARPKVLAKSLPKADSSEAVILLCHEPDFADNTAPTGHFDLQLSGHSHGGQIVLPIEGPPVLPTWAKKYPSGLYQIGTMQLYTSRGIGTVPPNVRFNCRPEIVLITLRTTES